MRHRTRLGGFLGTFGLLCVGTVARPTGQLVAQDRTVLQIRDIDQEGRQRLVDELKASGKPPIEYVVGCFEQHDLVLLGEAHMVRENCNLVAELIRPLYEAGIRQLATEFYRTRNADRIEELVTGEAFDDQLAMKLLRDNPWPTWGYQEYGGILEAVWQLNSSLPEEAERFRVVALDSDWDQYELWFGQGGQRANFETIRERETHMTSVLEQEALSPGTKTLVHTGFAHTITCQGERLGTVLFEKYGQRVFQICLHQDHPGAGGRSALTGFLEAVVADSGRDSVGFDVLGSPFEGLADESTMYWRMKPGVGLGSFAQGYVLLAPIEALHRVTWIQGFLEESNFERARAVAQRMGWVGEEGGRTPEELEALRIQRFPGP